MVKECDVTSSIGHLCGYRGGSRIVPCPSTQEITLSAFPFVSRKAGP